MQPNFTLNLHFVLTCGKEQYDERMGWGRWMREDGAKIWLYVTYGKLFVMAQHKIKGRMGWMEVGFEHLIEKGCEENQLGYNAEMGLQSHSIWICLEYGQNYEREHGK